MSLLDLNRDFVGLSNAHKTSFHSSLDKNNLDFWKKIAVRVSLPIQIEYIDGAKKKNRNGVSTYSNSSYRRICRCHRRPAKCQTPHVFAILADWHRPYWINATSADIRPFFTVSHSFAIRCINMPGLNNKVSRVKMQKKCEKCAKLITNQCWNNSTMCQLSIPYEILANYCENFV